MSPLIRGDARHLPLLDASVDCVVTSPPYWGLRDYGVDGQLGVEQTPDMYIAALASVFDEVRRVLKPAGTCWVNIGDSYQNAKGQAHGVDPKQPARRHGLRPQDSAVPGLKPKDLVGIPWMFAFEARRRGWYLRSDIVWAKPNPMPESCQDRPTKAHEYLFLLSKARTYYYDAQAIAEPCSDAMLMQMDQGYNGLGLKDYEAAGVQNPSSVKARIIANAKRKNEQSGDRRKVGFNDRWDDAEARRAELQSRGKYADVDRSAMRFGGAPGAPERNKRTVWTIPTMPYSGAHFATMPEALVEPCILAGCPIGGLVLDPFVGSGTVVAVAERLGRRGVGIDLSYQDLAQERTAQRGLRFEAAAPPSAAEE